MKISTFFLTISLILSLCSIKTYSQTGTISGSVIDKASGQPIEAASVSLHSTLDSSNITGANTDAQGKFTISNVKEGEYYVEVNMVGYSTAVVRGISVTAANYNITLSPISLKTGETTTEDINVETEKSDVQFSAEKKIFNVGNDITTTGGSVIDVLRNIPSVTVDQDGGVSLRGSDAVRILVNGKPYGLEGPNRSTILQSIAAENVERVELITNPSAKYKAEGVSGIINIVLKKNDSFGYNGTLNLNAGTKDKYNGDMSFNLRNDKVNLFTDYSYRLFNFEFSNQSSRNIFFSTDAPYYTIDATGKNRIRSHFARGGMDYDIDSLNALTLSASYNNRSNNFAPATHDRQFDAGMNLISDLFTKVKFENPGYNLDFGGTYTRKFSMPGRVFALEGNYTAYADDQNSTTTYSDLVTQTEPYTYDERQHSITYEANIKADYTQPIGKSFKLETGYTTELIDDNNTYDYSYLDNNTGAYVYDSSRANVFNFNRAVHAGYLQFGGELGSFSFQAGLRAENTYLEGELVNSNRTFHQDFFDLFPSASISNKFGAEQEVQLSYSRRIQRPFAGTLNPFPQFRAGSRNIFTGNPEIKPSYINSFELSVIKYLSTTTITPSFYYRHATDLITRARYAIDSVTTLTKFENYNTSDTYGADLIVNSRPFQWLNLSGSISYVKTKINADNIAAGLSNETSIVRGRVSAGLRLPELFNMQLSYFNSGTIATPQGDISPIHQLDAAVTKDFLEGKITAGLRVSDVLNTNKFEINFRDSSFSETLLSTRDSRTAVFTFTYRFGADDKNQKRRQGPGQENGSGFGF
jgi:5-hydroxyisourate hydrolase-like protein (transthyretin family)